MLYYIVLVVFVDLSRDFLFPIVPNDAPQNFTILVATPTSIFLRWDSPPPESRNGLILGFSITLTNDYDESVITYMAQSNEYEVTIENLVPYTTYVCTILAFTAIGNGPSSQSVMVTTSESGKCFSKLKILVSI